MLKLAPFLSSVRYFKASLFIGFIVTFVFAALYETGAIDHWNRALAALLHLTAPGPGTDRPGQYALVALCAFGIAWTTIDIPSKRLKWLVAVLALGQLAAAPWVAGLFGVAFSPFGALLAVSLSFLVAFAYSQSEAGLRKRRVGEIFGDRISTRTFAALVDAETPLKFEGEKREASVVVCEVFNHETLAATLPVADYVAMHNSFLRNASDLMVESGGYLDECDGESLRVIFGAPVADDHHAATACRCALALAERLNAVNRECHHLWQQTFDFRIGINSGELVVAAYGSRRVGRMSVAGEPVEFAHRLCAANTIYGSGLLMGAATFAQVEPLVEVRPMELIQRLAHEQTREEVYELLSLSGALNEEERERRDLFWKGIVYFRSQAWDEALSLFYSARRFDGSDGPVEFYIRRIEQMREGLPALEIDSTRL